MRISDWSSDVCSSDLSPRLALPGAAKAKGGRPLSRPLLVTLAQLRRWCGAGHTSRPANDQCPDGFERNRTELHHVSHWVPVGVLDLVRLASASFGTCNNRQSLQIGNSSCREGVCTYV